MEYDSIYNENVNSDSADNGGIRSKNGNSPPKRKNKRKFQAEKRKYSSRDQFLNFFYSNSYSNSESSENIENSEDSGYKPDYREEPCFESFTCVNCGRIISAEGAGSQHRNHCPHCLHSLHVDTEPGDRASDCEGDMEPVSVWLRKGGEWALIHRCKRCGKLSSNRVLSDDNPIELMSLAVRPLANPPFPLRLLEDFLRQK